MTSRERVLAALNHQEPDRVPIDLGGTFVTSIAAQSLDRLRKRLGLEDCPVKVFDLLQMLGEVEMDVVERLQVDVLPVEPPAMTFGLPRGDWKPLRLFDGTDVLVPGKFHVTLSPEGDWLLHPPSNPSAPPIGRMPKDGFYFDAMDYGGWNPDFKPPSLDHLRSASKSWVVKDDLLRYLEGRARTLRQSTDKALALGAWGMASLHYVGKLTEFLCLLSTDRPYVHDLFALCAERAVENLALLHQALGTNVDVIAACGLDFGSQRGELFPRETFRETYLPAYRSIFTWIHQNTSWKVFKHCDGSITNLLGDLVEAGVDILNPVQTSATGMAPRWLKETFGRKLTFWGGGVETQSTLPFGTPEQVRAEVAERIRIFAPGGGFVFNAIHNIQPNTPAENILAAYETALRVGRYPIS